jgi:hypothetical protein
MSWVKLFHEKVGQIMASERKIYCHVCATYCGTIRDASLMKGLVYTCITCQDPIDEDTFTSDHKNDLGDDFMYAFNSLIGKRKW